MYKLRSGSIARIVFPLHSRGTQEVKLLTVVRPRARQSIGNVLLLFARQRRNVRAWHNRMNIP